MPDKPEVHSPEAINYAFAKAIELLVAEGFGETADILSDCKHLIVQAVNSYPEMREALEGAVRD